MAKVGTQRGLKNYIQELRNCSTKEAEKERVDKELGKIRKKYTSEKSMSSYDKRKYMWKLLYTRMLGYDVDFGQKQAMDLIASTGYAEKQVGYVACGVFLNEKDELLRLVTNSVRNDLISRNEAFQCLALEFIANVGGAEFASLLTADVMAVLANGATRPVVRKKAALCLLRLLRKAPPDADVVPAEEWAGRLAAMLEERDPGLLLGLTTLLLGLVSRSSYEGYESCVPRLVHVLERLKARDVSQDYTYYGLASPWLQVRALRTLQYFPPPEDPATLRALADTVARTLAGSEPVKNPNKSNAVHAIVFEAAALAVGLGDPELLSTAVGLLARFLTVREPNLKYLALENMGRLAQAPEVAEAVARHQATVVACLHDADVSIRRRALDLLFTTANAASAPGVVDELLRELPRSDYALREELVLKAAVLAERFPPSSEWYVDAMLQLMEAAGDTAVDDVWHSVVQLVAGEPNLRRHAAEKVVAALQRGAAADVFLRCAAFVLGEHGALIKDATPLEAQFRLLHSRFPAAAPDTRAMLLSAYEKLRAAAPGNAALGAAVEEVMARHAVSADAELQQRAVEYRGLSARPGAAAAALAPLPPWEKRASLLLRRLAARAGDGEDEAREQPAWLVEAAAAEGVGAAAEGERPAAVELEPPAAVTESLDAEEQPGSATSATAAAAAAAPPVVPGLLDLLDLSDEPAAPAVPPAEPASEPAAPLDPTLAALSGLAVPVAAAAASANPFAEPEAPRPIEPTGDVSAWFAALCQAPSGVLYEDPNLQVGVKMTGGGATGAARLDLYLGNKSGQPLVRVVIAVPPSPAFTLALGPPPPVLEPGRQVALPLEVTCLAPFDRPPVLQLGYTLGGSGATLARTLDLPLVPTKFCTPVEVPPAVFTARWGQVVGAPFKLSQTVGCRGGGDDVTRLLIVLGLQVLPEVSAPGAVAAAAVFHCGGAGGAPPRQVPCMVKVEGLGAGQATVTVATADAVVSEALRAELAQQLARLG